MNQFLTSLESHGGVQVGTTDRLDNLDQATLRRFDVRVKPDYPDDKGIRVLLEYLAGAVDLSVDELALTRSAMRLAGSSMVPGEAALLGRRYRALRETNDVEQIVDNLLAEAVFRDRNSGRAMVFLATGS